MENNYDIKKIKNSLEDKIAISNFLDEDKDMNNKFIKPAIVACIILVSSFGIVFAKDIEKIVRDFWIGDKGIETAIENGYVEEPDMDFVESVAQVKIGNSDEVTDTINTRVKIKDFIMTDDLIRFTSVLEFDETMDKYKSFTKEAGETNYLNYISGGEVDTTIIESIEVEDLFILDEENRLLASPDVLWGGDSKQAFEKFCTEHNLDYEYEKYNENYYGYRNKSNGFEITTLYPEQRRLEGLWSVKTFEDTKYPRSKHLTIYFSKLSFTFKYSTIDNSDDLHLIGDWRIELDVPESMYNRKNIDYKVVSCSNPDFEMYNAYVTDTFFEIDFKIKNVEHIEEPQELRDYAEKYKAENGKGFTVIGSEEGVREIYQGNEGLIKLWENYNNTRDIINWWKREEGEGIYCYSSTTGTYVENSQNTQYELSEIGGGEVYDENTRSYTGIADYKLRFDLTKYDTTDSLKVFIDYNRGDDAVIVLEKID